MSSHLDKPFDEIAPQDIIALIKEGKVESIDLEFKRDPWSKTDSGNRELAKDICAIANASSAPPCPVKVAAPEQQRGRRTRPAGSSHKYLIAEQIGSVFAIVVGVGVGLVVGPMLLLAYVTTGVIGASDTVIVVSKDVVLPAAMCA